MAYTSLTPLTSNNRNEVSSAYASTFSAVGSGADSTYGSTFDAGARQDKLVLLIAPVTNNDTIKIKAGNTKSFGAIGDLQFNVTAGKTYVLTLDTAKYIQSQNDATLDTLTGLSDVKGKIVVSCGQSTTTLALVKCSI